MNIVKCKCLLEPFTHRSKLNCSCLPLSRKVNTHSGISSVGMQRRNFGSLTISGDYVQAFHEFLAADFH
jgi:hypothetical protein